MKAAVIFLIPSLLLLALKVEAQTTQPTARTTVAVLEFESPKGVHADLGRRIADALSTRLASDAEITLVERVRLEQVLEEQELRLTGLADETTGIRVGRLVGAQLVIVGRVVVQDGKLVAVARVIGAETSVMTIVSAEAGQDQGEPLAATLSEAALVRIREARTRLLAPPDDSDGQFAALRARLAGRTMPAVVVRVSEVHISRSVPDPAAQTEIELLLQQAGCKLMDPSSAAARPGAVRFLIQGEAFSEFASRRGNLVSCSARVEVRVVESSTGEVILVDRQTYRQTDASEMIAAKLALQEAGRRAALAILGRFAETIPPN